MKLPLFLLAAIAIILIGGTLRNPDYWSSPNRRGDALLREKKYPEAIKTYTDPARIATAQYRNGDFEAAAHTFKRVPGPSGVYDEANAWLMHGNYDAAVAAYDRALKLRPAWREAEDNKALALARKATLDNAGKDRDQEQTGQEKKDKPDGIAFDQKGNNKKSQPIELTEQSVSNEQLQATWLRQIKTTPGDFLKAKLAYQASKGGAK